MKKIISIPLITISLYSCGTQSQNEINQQPQNDTNAMKNTPPKPVEGAQSIYKLLKGDAEYLNPTIEKWIKHYRAGKQNIDLGNFIDKGEEAIIPMKGSILGLYDKGFDKVYTPFLIYSPNKKQYIDFDSYSWYVDVKDKSTPIFNIDQEVNVVSIENKIVQRVAFRGSSQWVEDAYWLNDSTIVLLENGTDYNPKITIVDLKKNKVRLYVYANTLKEASGYSDERLRLKGMNVSGE